MINIELEDESLEYEFEYLDNPGALPVIDLKNRSEGGKGPLQKGDKRENLVKILQQMLYDLGFDLGDTSDNEKVLDGKFGDLTENAVKTFQSTHQDWVGEDLLVDGMVGTQTADALNRSMVGIWFETYETPTELTQNYKLKTVASMKKNLQSGLKI